ncbi:MAG: hypothetical protein HQL22_04985 [Candidatus Omnitrophica bacterium]|nr:hypothetical protein [Candidatus Omnitrophota bacterium]
MKKLIENSGKPLAVFYAVMGLCFMALPAQGDSLPSGASIDAIERSIRALADPFVSKIKAPPEPTPTPGPVVVKPPEPLPTPTPKPPPPKIEAPALAISGILFSIDHPMAIINGEVVEQGQSIDYAGAKVLILKIDKDEVDVRYRNMPFTIHTDQEK